MYTSSIGFSSVTDGSVSPDIQGITPKHAMGREWMLPRTPMPYQSPLFPPLDQLANIHHHALVRIHHQDSHPLDAPLQNHPPPPVLHPFSLEPSPSPSPAHHNLGRSSHRNPISPSANHLPSPTQDGHTINNPFAQQMAWLTSQNTALYQEVTEMCQQYTALETMVKDLHTTHAQSQSQPSNGCSRAAVTRQIHARQCQLQENGDDADDEDTDTEGDQPTNAEDKFGHRNAHRWNEIFASDLSQPLQVAKLLLSKLEVQAFRNAQKAAGSLAEDLAHPDVFFNVQTIEEMEKHTFRGFK
ncbi:hypothetical protein NEOLEDRAFT_1151653 [Neolentinus lepideus HHB14362 ss-1]|uniref:Uncharacterized protein n=1 Tax=Neolentinus lepideus HHB14362 ss-1 TaxID=1314782 RepID=A0A165NPI1_9AGAM|nr:hypothetical protein NEOLEDRAFT_1151653 [Neolentinus lepideus HHB14362 ss-1]